MWVLEAVSPDRDIVTSGSTNIPETYNKDTESAAQLSRAEDQTLSRQLKEARESCEYLSQSDREELVICLDQVVRRRRRGSVTTR